MLCARSGPLPGNAFAANATAGSFFPALHVLNISGNAFSGKNQLPVAQSAFFWLSLSEPALPLAVWQQPGQALRAALMPMSLLSSLCANSLDGSRERAHWLRMLGFMAAASARIGYAC